MARRNPILVLQARAEARATLFAAAAIDTMGEALDPLFAYALRSGIVDELGADATWCLIEAPFRRIELM